MLNITNKEIIECDLMLDLCKKVESKKQTFIMIMPFPNSKNVKRPRKSFIFSGCYALGTKENLYSYIGQSVHLGSRVIDHIRGKVKTTKELISTIKKENDNRGIVDY